MSHHKLLATSLVLLLFLLSPATQAQTTESTAELKRRVSELMEQTKYTEALPLLEKIATLEPNDGATQFYLGFALIG
jgi:Flp pilus assembly protein TadD